jgi:GDP-4-dehydro-6-deoxy-D-mannose reductase
MGDSVVADDHLLAEWGLQRSRPHVALVTGAGGFVGRHMVAALLNETVWEIVAVDRQPGRTADGPRVQARVADVRDAEAVRAVLDDCRPDLVFHIAGQTPPASDADLFSTNVLGTSLMLERLATSRPGASILIVGSDAQYGPQAPAWIPTPERAPQRPLNAYGRSKLLQEQIARRYARLTDLRVICVRPFNHIGPGQRDAFLVPTLARQIARAEAGVGAPRIELGRIDAQRDFSDVRDIVQAYLRALVLGASGQVYNVGSGIATSIREIVSLLERQARVPITFVPEARGRRADVDVTRCDARRLRLRTDWHPTIPLERTLGDTLDDWRRRVAAEIRAGETGSASSILT